MPAKCADSAQGCSDPVCNPSGCSASEEVGTHGGFGCWAGQLTLEDLQLVFHLNGSGDNSNALSSINARRRQGLKPNTEHPCLPLALTAWEERARLCPWSLMGEFFSSESLFLKVDIDMIHP